jgi:hypothetical protein
MVKAASSKELKATFERAFADASQLVEADFTSRVGKLDASELEAVLESGSGR